MSKVIEALKEAERFMEYFAGETDNTFVGGGTPKTCLAQIREALSAPPAPAPIEAEAGLAQMVLDFFATARAEGLWVGAGRDGRLPFTDEAQYGPKAKALLAAATVAARAPAATDPDDACPVCAEAFKPEDVCATDIELGICHSACLEGSAVVDLNTGEPSDGPIDTYLYGETAAPAPAARMDAERRVAELAEELRSAASLLETLAEDLPEDDVSAIMMRVMAQRNRAALSDGGRADG